MQRTESLQNQFFCKYPDLNWSSTSVPQTTSSLVQVEAEKKAAAAAQEGNAKRLRDAEARVESLEETVEELRVAMDRQRAAADLR